MRVAAESRQEAKMLKVLFVVPGLGIRVHSFSLLLLPVAPVGKGSTQKTFTTSPAGCSWAVSSALARSS
jgi:hypothetical protein